MNMKIFGLAAVALMFAAGPALAEGSCQEPIPPVAIDGGNSTPAQMGQAHDDVLTFIKQSDDYQSCLLTDLTSHLKHGCICNASDRVRDIAFLAAGFDRCGN